MNFKFAKKLCALFLASIITLGSLAVHAAADAEVESDGVTVLFEDITTSDETTTKGQAKIMVSIAGITGNVSAIQLSLGFSEDTDMLYDSILFLIGEDNAPECIQIEPVYQTANSKHTILPAVVAREDSLELTGTTPFCIITFEGNPGDTVQMWVDDLDLSYCTADGEDIFVSDVTESEVVTASDTENKGADARIRLDLSGILENFISGGGYVNSGIKIDITNQKSSKQITVNAANKFNGGHRENVTQPIFTIDTTVLDDEDDLYTVEVSGIGYVTATFEDVYFGDLSSTEGIEIYDQYSDNIDALLITHEDFIPGDVDGDGEITKEDYNKCKELQGITKQDSDYNLAADFDRTGTINEADLKVFDSYNFGEEKTTVPGKVVAPTVSGGENKITVKWTAPEDNGGSPITNYVIKYGTSSTSLTSVKEPSAGATEYTISGLETGTKYYVQIAAENAVGIGEYSNVISATTSSGGGGGGGGTGGTGGAGGGAAPMPVNYTVTYNLSGGTLAQGAVTESVAAGSAPSKAPTVNAPDGMVFAGWSTDGKTVVDISKLKITTHTTLTAVYKAAGSEVDPGTSSSEIFTDLESHAWAKEAIYTLKEKGIINGTSETTYSPANNIKRGDFILILVRMLGIDGEAADNFTDVPAESYYADAIAKARAAGIANGYDNGDGTFSFKPEDTITRQDLITLAYRAFLAKGYITEATDTTSLDAFADKADISDYAVSAMASMVSGGIIQGSGGNVNSRNNATRAEVAVMCARLLAIMG